MGFNRSISERSSQDQSAFNFCRTAIPNLLTKVDLAGACSEGPMYDLFATVEY